MFLRLRRNGADPYFIAPSFVRYERDPSPVRRKVTAGCALANNLTVAGVAFEKYLEWLVIHDATGTKKCNNSIQFAFTAPGSRVVFVCGRAFAKMSRGEPARATAVLIHEALHTLGLGENGTHSTSREITDVCWSYVSGSCRAITPRWLVEAKP